MNEWHPNPGPQTRFLASRAYEALYGGAAGGGKSDALLIGALRHVHVPGYSAILFRRTFPELEKSLIARSHSYFKRAIAGADYNEQKKRWSFPSGALIYFGHLEHDRDVVDYQSAEFQYIGFDELTSFTERQYVYLLSRARSSGGIPVRIRSATNPGGEGHDWVMRRWGPWLDRNPEYTGQQVEPGHVLHYENTATGEEWCEPGAETLSRVFIPAKLDDNPHLTENDPAYRQRLMGQDAVTRAQLLDGNWLIKPAAGLYFKRAWFKFLEAPPAGHVQRIRYWDRAATAAENGKDPDWTVGLKLSRTAERQFVIEDVVRIRGTPMEVESTIVATAHLDGHAVAIGIEEDPGSAGKFESAYYVRALQGFNVRPVKPTGDKVTRAGPASAQCEAGNVSIVRGAWNTRLVEELEAFPSPGVHDDQVDALSGAVSALAFGSPSFKGLGGFQGRGWRA